jgi:hypothetical protein
MVVGGSVRPRGAGNLSKNAGGEALHLCIMLQNALSRPKVKDQLAAFKTELDKALAAAKCDAARISKMFKILKAGAKGKAKALAQAPAAV